MGYVVVRRRNGALVKALKGSEKEGLVRLRLGRFLEDWEVEVVSFWFHSFILGLDFFTRHPSLCLSALSFIGPDLFF